MLLSQYNAELAQDYADCPRLCVVQDNCPNRTHPEIRRMVQQLRRIELVFLPTYVPYKIPEEKVWRRTKQRLIHAHPYSDDFNEFKRQIAATLDDADRWGCDLLRYCGLQDNNKDHQSRR